MAEYRIAESEMLLRWPGSRVSRCCNFARGVAERASGELHIWRPWRMHVPSSVLTAGRLPKSYGSQTSQIIPVVTPLQPSSTFLRYARHDTKPIDQRISHRTPHASSRRQGGALSREGGYLDCATAGTCIGRTAQLAYATSLAQHEPGRPRCEALCEGTSVSSFVPPTSPTRAIASSPIQPLCLL